MAMGFYALKFCQGGVLGCHSARHGGLLHWLIVASPVQAMPLPCAPTRSPANKASRHTANNELALKGILCTLIGLGVLVSPFFISSPGMQGIVAKSQLVGWFALVLGIAFLVLYGRRRLKTARD